MKRRTLKKRMNAIVRQSRIDGKRIAGRHYWATAQVRLNELRDSILERAKLRGDTSAVLFLEEGNPDGS